MSTESRPAAVYCRISRDKVGAGLGVDRQRADCEQLAEQLGWSIVAVHTDNDVSAYSGRRRPGYEALLADLAAGTVRGVIAWHTDRLHRSPRELESYIDACETNGAVTHTVRAGHLDLSTASGRMVARQLGVVARFESEHKGERVAAARLQMAHQGGRWGGGIRPFGFESDGVTVRPDEAAEIITATESILAGASLRSLTRDLNERGVRTSHGNRWETVALRDVLRRARNAGLATYKGEVVGAASWPPIVSEDQWRGVVSILNDPGRRTSPASTAVKWLGSHLYRCGVCEDGGRIVCSTSGSVRVGERARKPAYRCSTRDLSSSKGHHLVRNAVAVDQVVTEAVLLVMSKMSVALADDEPTDSASVHADAAALRQRLDDLSMAFADGDITAAQLRAGSERLRSRLEVAEAAIARSAMRNPIAALVGADDIAARWEHLDLEQQRAIIDELCVVTILPARRGPKFDPTTVRLDWR